VIRGTELCHEKIVAPSADLSGFPRREKDEGVAVEGASNAPTSRAERGSSAPSARVRQPDVIACDGSAVE
jgi:hypothetical protein